ncbi:MAG: hypothetical protein C75L2_00140035 [Leptospirillum sp. Group II 'C75']|jgi:hypothetical protein|uniref:Uncharacterized protein n=1 Tax=Leptospirillum sp. Group II '5-way CG' TaxID=419541 RepID=B6AN08_9BACT|nr:prenyltransferase/squalene oxidase repeat-containing protein [Leptospirillum sp. Group II 'CF-1']AKS24564.1 hypothetical protein ABH19_13570 [Leptospirillum sp. Group II 'CF-1']EDZ39865.1 MAG: Protein of unknown function [Leptospirillum sp. Group II '5-way CG']EIJ75901.1 MAG: hypothetical protein C75L2_00140035 [Leptospirillum sp. Group II 'C75']
MNTPEPFLSVEERLLDYVRNCRMDNGSYCGWRYREWGLPSIQDTFWALRIYRKLSRTPPSAGRTRRWLESELPSILEEGDPEKTANAFCSFQMMGLTFPSEKDWLSPLSKHLFPAGTTVLEIEGKIRASWLWLVLERHSPKPLPSIRNQLARTLERWMSDVREKRIVLDLPGFGALVEGLRAAGCLDKPIIERVLNLYREPDGGYRLTPDSRTESMECLWWGMRLDRLCSDKNTQAFTALEETVFSCEARNGGFGPRPGAIPDLPSTGMALDLLRNIHPRPLH